MIKRYKRKRNITFVALVVAICIMSIGFAAFSSELNISSNAIVSPNASDFKVVFSSSGTSYLTNKISGVGTGSATGGYASIDNSGDTPIISDLTASFTGPGETVTYEFYVYNIGAYVAYLREVKFNNVNGESSNKVCSAIDSSSVTNSLLESACNDISVSISVGNDTFGGSNSNIYNHGLNKSSYEKVVVTISYASNDNRSDGDFKVEFGDIGLTYSTVAAVPGDLEEESIPEVNV